MAKVVRHVQPQAIGLPGAVSSARKVVKSVALTSRAVNVVRVLSAQHVPKVVSRVFAVRVRYRVSASPANGVKSAASRGPATRMAVTARSVDHVLKVRSGHRAVRARCRANALAASAARAHALSARKVATSHSAAVAPRMLVIVVPAATAPQKAASVAVSALATRARD